MAISPKDPERLAVEIRRIYADAEIQILMNIAKRFVKGDDIADWQLQKLAQLTDVRRDAQKVVSKLDKQVPKIIRQVIELAYLSGNKSAVDDLKKALGQIDSMDDHPEIQEAIPPNVRGESIKIQQIATMETFTGINAEAVTALAASTTEQLTDKHLMIVRSAMDIYRSIITRVAGSTLTGAETRLEIAQRALNDFANKGIKTFRDRSGRNWDIATYAEMATRTAVGQASVQGHINTMKDMGFDLVQVSDHKEECELCRPYEGEILSISGNDPDHDPLNEAISRGLFHTNCGHRLNTYFEGLTKPLTNTEDPEGYEKRQDQRRLERQIRHWKKRQAVAITERDKKRSAAKVREWQAQMREFIDDTGRRRRYNRESIKRAR